jgi:hypothetical protein
MHLRGGWTRLVEQRANPVLWTEVTQVLKTVLAASCAWVLATRVFDFPQPFLAPWSALLVVHATVYRSVSQGVRQVSGAVLGVFVAWVVGNSFGAGALGVALAVLVGLALGATAWFAEETTMIAATSVVVLATGFTNGDSLLLRLAGTATGIAVGLVVNLIVWPPLRRSAASTAVETLDDQIGQLLIDMAVDLSEYRIRDPDPDEWVDRTRAIDSDLDSAWALVRQTRESARLNPRRGAAAVRRPGEWNVVLGRMEQAVAETRSMARTIDHSIIDVHEWDAEFRARWTRLLRRAGEAIRTADHLGIADLRSGLDDLARDLSNENLSARHWPEYGGLIINLRNTVMSMNRVAAFNPMVPVPAVPPTVRR